MTDEIIVVRMKRLLILALIFMAGSIDVLRADPRIDRIRTLYEKSKGFERENDGNVQSVTISSVLPAVGLKTLRIKFVNESWQVDPRDDPYNIARRLVKVTAEYNVAASVLYHTEHLFDERGRHVFSYWLERFLNNNPPNEKRYYYENGGIIRLVADYTDAKGDRIKKTATGKLTAEERKRGTSLALQASEYLKHFRRMIDLDKMN